MKNIVSKATVALSVILTATSICAISSVDCLKGFLPLQRTVINKKEVLYGLEHGDINLMPYNLIPLFYIGLILILISSIVNFSKSNKMKSITIVALSFIPPIFVLITHNYIWFLILMNLYLLIKLLSDFKIKDKIKIVTHIIAFATFVINLVQAIKHLRLTFSPSDISVFYTTLVYTSDITLKVIYLWLIPYTIPLTQDIKTTHKTTRTVD